MVKVTRGDVVWMRLPRSADSTPSGDHPAVVIQSDTFNDTALNTVTVILMTSKLHYAMMPGNVRIPSAESGLPKPSVVNVTQIASFDRSYVVEKAGRLGAVRMSEIWSGVVTAIGPVPAGSSNKRRRRA